MEPTSNQVAPISDAELAGLESTLKNVEELGAAPFSDARGRAYNSAENSARNQYARAMPGLLARLRTAEAAADLDIASILYLMKCGPNVNDIAEEDQLPALVEWQEKVCRAGYALEAATTKPIAAGAPIGAGEAAKVTELLNNALDECILENSDLVAYNKLVTSVNKAIELLAASAPAVVAATSAYNELRSGVLLASVNAAQALECISRTNDKGLIYQYAEAVAKELATLSEVPKLPCPAPAVVAAEAAGQTEKELLTVCMRGIGQSRALDAVRSLLDTVEHLLPKVPKARLDGDDWEAINNTRHKAKEVAGDLEKKVEEASAAAKKLCPAAPQASEGGPSHE